MLQTLNISGWRLADLGPLSACMMLQTLDLRDCVAVKELGLLSACTMLHTLDLSGCKFVANLGPLAMLQTLACVSNTGGGVVSTGNMHNS